MGLMNTLDDVWNVYDWDTFNKRHTEYVPVYWPGKPEPTRGRPSHKNEALLRWEEESFFKYLSYELYFLNSGPRNIFYQQIVKEVIKLTISYYII
jgi:hypothetical protein